jgi:hypothetical protein
VSTSPPRHLMKPVQVNKQFAYAIVDVIKIWSLTVTFHTRFCVTSSEHCNVIMLHL